MMQPFTHAQLLYLNEVQENIRAEFDALRQEIQALREALDKEVHDEST